VKNLILKIVFCLTPLFLLTVGAPVAAQTTIQKAPSSNIEKVIELLKSIESGDTGPAQKYINAETYTQHMPTAPDGRNATLAMIAKAPSLNTKIEIARIFEDDDKVVAHIKRTVQGRAMSVITIWRFNEQGQAVEHWEGGQVMPEFPNRSGHTMVDGEFQVVDLDKTDANKKLVATFMDDVFRKGNYQNSDQYISRTTYIQHNPNVSDGLDGFVKAISYLSDTFKSQVTKKILGQGNFVLVVSDLKNVANYDIFRLDGGKIVEHWDLQSPIPPVSEIKNKNGVF
jgi:predicted SnoaL-like aldol condensation-catalyzing enzyme